MEVSLGQLIYPIVLAAILVFVLSSIVHMVLPIHKSDYRQLPNEDEVRAAIRKGNPAPGQYIIPYCADMKQSGTPEMTKKFTEGPVGLMYLRRPGPMAMGGALGSWFVFCLVISVFVAYLTCHTLPSGTAYLQVFRVAGTAAWLGYAGAVAPGSIWMGKPWVVTAKEIFDGLLYALVTAGAFGWLWPR
jgi:hypothetical protein